MPNYCRYTMAYLYGYGLCFKGILGYYKTYHAGLAVQRLWLVEDKVANAVVDFLAAEILDGLHRVGMMAYQHVGTGINQLMGIPTLAVDGLQRVFPAPMQRYDNNGC